MPSVCATPKRGHPGQRRRRHPLPIVTAPPHRALTPRQATWLVLRRPEQRTPVEEHLLAQLTAQHAELGNAIALAQDFAQLVRQRQAQQLDPRLARRRRVRSRPCSGSQKGCATIMTPSKPA